MRQLLSARRYEALALGIFLVFAIVHVQTSEPLMGLTDKGGLLHRTVQNLDGRISTLFFRARGPRPAHPGVVVIEIDERGARKYGLWPWPRDLIATALDHLIDADAKVIGLDIDFNDERHGNEEKEKAWLTALQTAEGLPESLAPLKAELESRVAHTPDDVLREVLKKAGPRVVQGTIPFAGAQTQAFSEEQRAEWAKAIKDQVITTVPGTVKGSVKPIEKVDAYPFIGVLAPLPKFADVGSRMGHFASLPDIDSTIRRSPLLIRLEEPPGLLPSLALAVSAAALDAQIVPVVPEEHLEAVRLVKASGEVVFPVEAESPLTLINYPGDDKVFERLSIVDVIDGNFDKSKVAGKALLMGVTIIGSSGDQRVTPFSEFASGVFTHAALVSNALTGDFLNRPAWLNFLEVGSMLVLGLLVSVVTPRIRSFTGKILLIATVLAGFTAVAFFLFTSGLKVNWVVPAFQLTVTAFSTIFVGYLSVDREKLKMRSTFSRYLGEDVMDAAMQDPERLNRGEKREMTVMFSDIRGFTSLSEHMSPEKLADFINEYLSPMTQIVFEEKGTLDKYIGDAVMAFWNAPLDLPDHAYRSCVAAVHMLDRLEVLKEGWRKRGYPELEIGIGINTGQMVVGNMGSDVRVDYTVLGDSVNLGSRLEGTNKEYDTRIIISESTRKAVKDGIVTRRLGAVRVKGKKVPVGIYELRALGLPNEADGKAIPAFEGALEAWTARKFDEAERLFTEVLKYWPNDSPTQNYLSELQEFRVTPPPPDWDGVVSLKTK